MAAEHELALTSLFNEYLAGPANAVLGVFGIHAENPKHPWPDWMVMELFVVALIMVTVAVVRAQLSAENPGKLQQVFELIYQFIADTISEVGIHHGERFIYFIGTISGLHLDFLTMNLIGIIPVLDAPTNFIFST